MPDKFHIDENLKIINEMEPSSNDYPEDYEYQRESFAPLNFYKRGLKKSQIKEIAASAVENVLINGDPLLVAEALAGMEAFIKEVKADERFKNYTREETAKYPKGFISASGAKIELAEVGSSYNYDQCNDEVLVELEEKLAELEVKVKERKEFLKTIPLAGIDIITADGEAVHLYPPSKSSISSYKVTLSK